MGKALIIAEKPSVAEDIAKALGGFKQQGASSGKFFERDDLIVAAARGHLIQISLPESEDPGWVLARLPVIPSAFELTPVKSTPDRDSRPVLKLLTELIHRKDVSLLINACDAGREGELIFRLIVEYVRTKKPIERMWLQSMTPAAIRQGFKQRKTDEEMAPLAAAARSRSEADFLVGINGTRVMSKSNIVEQDAKITAGRVQTPTLALVVDLELRRRTFKPVTFWEVHAEFQAKAGLWDGKWFDHTLAAEPQSNQEGSRRADRVFDPDKAASIIAACKGVNPSSVVDTSKPVRVAAPSLFDLTTLQREANKLFGFSAANTLKYAQSLYERTKMLTYPRTNSRHLPEDYCDTVISTMKQLPSPYARFAASAVDEGMVKPGHRNFDSSKITDHFAIIPTGVIVEGLPKEEQMIFDLVARRFIASFYPSAEFLESTRIATIGEHQFKTIGKVLQKASWQAVYPGLAPSSKAKAEVNLPPLDEGETAITVDVTSKKGETTPPPRYTEATLLAAMESAGKLIDDEELAQAMAENGLGTPATRARTIEDMLDPVKNYCNREGKDLVPTDKGIKVIQALRDAGVDMLTHPELTGAWEKRLAMMERGQERRETFMEEINQTTRDLVDRIRAKAIPDDPSARRANASRGTATGGRGGDFKNKDTGIKCRCKKGNVEDANKWWKCSACGMAIWREPAHRPLESADLQALMKDGKTPVLNGFKSKAGNVFAAALELEDGGGLKFAFPPRN